MMLSGYNSISDSNNSPDRMNLEKVDQNASNKKYLFIGLISGMIIGIIIGVIIGLSLQVTNNNGLIVPSHAHAHAHVNLEEQFEQQPSNLDFDNDDVHANMANSEKYANSHDFSSNADISSDASVITWDGKAKLTDLSDGNIVTIRSAVNGGFLRNPGSTDRVKTSVLYETNRHLWTVYYDSSQAAYKFQNLEDNCWLQSHNGLLKCLSNSNGQVYWISDGAAARSEDSSDFKRKYTRLKNKNNNKCPSVATVAADEKIDMSSNNCNVANSGFRFEVVH